MICSVNRRLKHALLNRGLGGLLRGPRRLFGGPDFVVFTIGRSGSTVLMNLLGQHPLIHSDGELFHCFYGEERIQAAETGDDRTWPWDRSPFYPGRPLAFLRSRLPYGGLFGSYGFDIKFFHICFSGMTVPEFIASVKSMGIRHFAVLERRNTLRVIVSSRIAQENDYWHTDNRSETDLKRKVRLDVDAIRNDGEVKPLIDYLESYRASFAELRQCLQGERSLWLTYEDDIADDPTCGYRKMCQFIGRRPHPVEVRLRKTNPSGVRDLLDNADEVEARLRGSDFAWMLDA